MQRPWNTGKRDNHGVLWDAVFAADGQLVALVNDASDAATIAAAPDLLAACKAAIRFLDLANDDMSGETYQVYVKLRDALARAKP